jgi:hypothetical protein
MSVHSNKDTGIRITTNVSDSNCPVAGSNQVQGIDAYLFSCFKTCPVVTK